MAGLHTLHDFLEVDLKGAFPRPRSTLRWYSSSSRNEKGGLPELKGSAMRMCDATIRHDASAAAAVLIQMA